MKTSTKRSMRECMSYCLRLPTDDTPTTCNLQASPASRVDGDTLTTLSRNGDSMKTSAKTATREFINQRVRSVAGTIAAAFVGHCAAAGTDIPGGTTANATDITAYLLANQDVNFTGGAYIVRIPAKGAAGLATVAAAETVAGQLMSNYGSGHFVDSGAPTILYTGVMSGLGSLTVTNRTSNVNPDANQSFSGGVLAITKPQTYRNGSNVGLTIDPNTTLAAIAGANLGTRNSLPVHIINNGYIYSWNIKSGSEEASWGSIQSTVPGAGVVTFESGNRLGPYAYSGNVFVMNGSHIDQSATFPDPALKLTQSNIVTFETRGPRVPLALRSGEPTAPAPNPSIFSGNYYSFGVDTQINGTGLQIFNGMAISPLGSNKKDYLPPEDGRKANYFGGLRNGRGMVFYLQSMVQMGNGETIVNNADGTNNTFMQTNVLGTSGGLQVGGFQGVPANAESTPYLQGVAFNYSGTYKYDAGINAGSRDNGQLFPLRPDHGNFVLLNPDRENTGRAPNHMVLTAPVLLHGITHIYRNAILQLGDGTVGNSETRSISLGGRTYSGVYSDSYGNGMILTQANAPTNWGTSGINIGHGLTAEFDIINNNGKLIVNNTPNALSITSADETLQPWMAANTLDGIVGSGAVEQIGKLPLTLTGISTYTGGTLVGAGSTLKVASSTALGSKDGGAGAASGRVVVKGTLQASGATRTINVPGDYAQR